MFFLIPEEVITEESIQYRLSSRFFLETLGIWTYEITSKIAIKSKGRFKSDVCFLACAEDVITEDVDNCMENEQEVSPLSEADAWLLTSDEEVITEESIRYRLPSRKILETLKIRSPAIKLKCRFKQSNHSKTILYICLVES